MDCCCDVAAVLEVGMPRSMSLYKLFVHFPVVYLISSLKQCCIPPEVEVLAVMFT